MKIILKILLLFAQAIITFIVLCVIYMIFALMDNDFGIDGMFGLFIVQPLFAVILSILTIIVCGIIGLPIRLIKSVNNWYSKYWYISIISVFVGIFLLILSFVFKESIYIEDGIIETPNSVLVVTGWFITAFSILHLFPPKLNKKSALSALSVY